MGLQNKCCYRIRVLELLTQDKVIPKTLENCENCNGIKSEVNKDCYLDLEHLINFRDYTLNKTFVSHSQR